MAGGIVTSGSEIEFEAKITFTVIMSCILAATGGLMFGYDIGISGTYITFQCFFLLYLLYIINLQHMNIVYCWLFGKMFEVIIVLISILII